jgi:hypothetical protein
VKRAPDLIALRRAEHRVLDKLMKNMLELDKLFLLKLTIWDSDTVNV